MTDEKCMCGCGKSIEGESCIVGVEGMVLYDCAERIRKGKPSKNLYSPDGFRLQWKEKPYHNRKMDEAQRADYERCLAWGKRYEQTGNPKVFIRDSRLEAIERRSDAPRAEAKPSVGGASDNNDG